MSSTARTAQHLRPTASGDSGLDIKVGTDSSISAQRRQIDDIDAEIVSLLSNRLKLSAQIQRLRLDSGGPRLSIARETEIVQRYASTLGHGGAEVAQLVLKLSRGPARRAS